MPNLLEVDSVRKSFDTKVVLTDIYLRCETGNIIGLLGRNGSGKSTLLKIVYGTMNAENKFVRIDGTVHEQAYKKINEICYLPQDPFLPGQFTVKKAVELYLGKQAVPAFCNDPVLSVIINSKISIISGGEARYLEIKLLLSLDCKFVLLDEPFNGISPIMIEKIKAMITNAATSKGIILTDHDYNNVLDVANKQYLIYDGCIKEIKNKSDLVKWGYLPESKLESENQVINLSI